MSKTFLQNLFFNNISQGLQFGSRWIFNLILIVLLTDANFGIFAYVIALANILIAILPFGSPVYLIGFITQENKNKLLSDSLAILLFFFIISLLVYVLLLPFRLEHFDLLLYGLLLGFVYALNTVLYFYFKSLGKFSEEIKASFISFVLILLFIVFNIYSENKVTNVGLIFTILILINLSVTFYLFIFSRYINFKEISKHLIASFKNIKQLLKLRLYYGLQEIMSASYSQIGMFILFYFLVEERYGAYRKLFIIIAPIYLLSVTFSQVLLHHLKRYSARALVSEFRKYQRYTVLGAVVVVGILYIFREFLLETLGKLTFTAELSYAFILVILVCFTRFLFGNYEMFLVKIDKQKSRFWIMLFAGIANITSILILVPRFDLIGAVMTDVIANLIVLLGVLLISEKEIKKLY